jgi:hypothetical protein
MIRMAARLARLLVGCVGDGHLGGRLVRKSPFEATLIEHWNGKRWSQVASSAGGSVPNVTLSAVAASSPKSVWAVGNSVDGGGNRRTFIEHWDGVRWTQVHSLDPGGPIGAMPAQNTLTSPAVSRPS